MGLIPPRGLTELAASLAAPAPPGLLAPDSADKSGGPRWRSGRWLHAVISPPQRAFRAFRATLARLAGWWAKLTEHDRQVYLKAGLLIAIPSIGIPWFGVVIGTGLGAMVGIVRALGGF